jgi:hypothetical protein
LALPAVRAKGRGRTRLTLKKSNHTQPCFSSALVKDFCGLFSLLMALCTGDCARKKVFLFR